MKRRVLALSLLLVLALGAAAAADDPLVTLSYLKGQFTEAFAGKVEDLGDREGAAVYNSALDQAALAAAEASVYQNLAEQPTEASLKQGDVVAGPTGFALLPLSGSVTVSFDGAVVDVTDGTEIRSGSVLTAQHRYLVAEDTLATFTVTSQTAVVQYEGYHAFARSASTVDYVAMADALKLLNLFQGSDTGYGNGYNLEQYPTRMQALVMFIRVLGEEEEALACTSPCPFTDITWGHSYAAYAYEKGYAVGYGDGRFGAGNTVDATSYMEFLLRAMGYSKAGVDDWSTAMERAADLGVITAGERDAIASMPFHRAQVVYLSYRSLEATLSDGSTSLSDQLIRSGVFTSAQLTRARDLVSDVRLG